jgi:Holliday junction resolvasome RuvABC endonuclease subunit
MTNPTILAIDPGLRELGYAVVTGPRLVRYGVLPLRLLPKAHRLPEAKERIKALVEVHRPAVLVLEKTYRHPVPWLNQLHHITLAARRIARARRIELVSYSPQAVRSTVAGSGKAKKPETAIAVSHRFRQLRLFLTQDRRYKERFWLNAFDAVALALHHQSLTNPSSRSR